MCSCVADTAGVSVHGHENYFFVKVSECVSFQMYISSKHTKTKPPMRTILTHAELVNAIADAHDAGLTAEAERLFLELYARIRDHFFRAYCSVLRATFKSSETSPRAEKVFQVILNEIEREIRRRKFTVATDAADEVVRKRLAVRVLRKAVWRTNDAIVKQKFVSGADLAPGQLERHADVPDHDSEENEHLRVGIAYVFANLADKDREMIQLYHYSGLAPEAAEEILREKYELGDSAFKKALYRAKERFKELWKEYLSMEYRLTTNYHSQNREHNEKQLNT